MDMLHALLVDLHSVNRWIFLLLGFYALVVAFRCWQGQSGWHEEVAKAGRYALIALDVQLLLGLVLYGMFVGRQGGFAYVFGNAASRFFIMEHSVMMVVAIVVAHVGYALAKKRGEDGACKRLFWFFVVAYLLILVSIPWPFMPGFGRPLLF